MNKTYQPTADRPARRLPHQHAWIDLAAAVWIAAAFVVQGQPTLSASLPKDLSVSLNATAQFQVSASGTGPLTYQWWFKDAPLDPGSSPKATNTLLVINYVSLSDAGTYWAVVSDTTGSATSRVATLIVDATFTKITEGPVVTDAEGSVSACWADFDNDGNLDLVVANAILSGTTQNAFYKNQSEGTFVRNSTNAIAKAATASFATTAADYDNDGKVDLFAANIYGTGQLFRNEGGGRFTRLAGKQYGPIITDSGLSEDAACADYDRDGFLDLFTANGNGQALNDCLYRNDGNGRFIKMTAAEVGPLVNDHVESSYCAWADYDNDGWPDLWVGTLSGANFLYHNDGNGRFSSTTNSSITSIRLYGPGAWGDYDNDGFLDFFQSGWTSANALHHNLSGAAFTNVAVSAGVALSASSGEAAWGDYDNDGWLDLFVPQYSGGTSALFRNQGDGTFRRVDVGSPMRDGDRRTSASWADYDNDGFLDLFIACGDGMSQRNYLYHNNGNSNHWLKVRLAGKASNASAVGAKVRVKATIRGETLWQLREINGNSGMSGGTPGFIAHFGLGDATNVDLVRIEWPSGNVQELSDQSPDQMLKITERVLVKPVNPSSSLGGSVTLTSPTGDVYQWQFNDADLTSQTNRTLVLTNIQASQQGRYSVVVTSGDTTQTNYTYMHLDTQFTKITTGPLVTDLGSSYGAAWGDFDGDGYPDLFVSRYKLGVSTFYHNNRDGTFSATATVPSQQTPDVWLPVVSADFDNDGKLDLFVPRENKPGFFYFNNGDGTFTSSQFQNANPWNISAFDYNNDGLLDLYLSASGWNILYRNNDGRTFRKVTTQDAGDLVSVGTWSGVAAADYDDDGWVDVYAAGYHYGNRSFLFHNDGTGRFSSVTNLVTRSSAPALVGAWGDYDNDGRLDLFVACFSHSSPLTSTLYRNLGSGEFEVGQTFQGAYNSVCWADYDNDGFLDFFLTGFEVSNNALYHNNGDGTFTQITTGSIITDRQVSAVGSYNGLWFDYDNDGFLDLYVVNESYDGTAKAANFLYHNNGNANSWLRVKLVGTTSNRGGVGAKVRVQAKYADQVRWQRRDITAGDVYNGNHLDAHFGLGDATNVMTLRIEWPSGAVQELTDVAPKQLLTVWEPPGLRGVVLADSSCQLTITAEPNRTWQIQVSTDLKTWQKLETVTNTQATFQFKDTTANGMDCRFYRVVAE